MTRKNYWVLLIAVLVIPIFTACDSRLATELLTPPTSGRTIHVNGNGSVTGDPDIASLNLGVSVEKKTVAEAREEAASSMTALIETLMANNIEEKDISTENFSIYPQYDWTEEGRILKGYRVNNTVRAKVRDLNSISDVIDDATEAGGDYIVLNSIQFMIEDTTEYRHQARTLAVKDAEAKAKTLAEASGVTLGKPVTISENTYYESPPIPYEPVAELAADDGARSSTPIVPGEQTITVNVTIIYEIE